MKEREDYISLGGFSITANNLDHMVHFYNTILGAELTPIHLGDALFYEGRIGNLNISLSTTEHLRTSRPSNSHQLSFVVSNLDKIVDQVKNTGGTLLQEVCDYDSDRYCGIADPDGNTIELIEPQQIVVYK